MDYFGCLRTLNHLNMSTRFSLNGGKSQINQSVSIHSYDPENWGYLTFPNVSEYLRFQSFHMGPITFLYPQRFLRYNRPAIVKVFWDTDTPQVLYSPVSSQKIRFECRFDIFVKFYYIFMLQATDKAFQVFKFQETLLGL
jgi:hypothetical protein